MTKLQAIAKENGIDDISDAYGKTLLLQAILKSMDEAEANQFMDDTLMMLDDEINSYQIDWYDDSPLCAFDSLIYGAIA